jgi:hypothetical protein
VKETAMTAFTLIHTLITLLPVGFGLYGLARYGRIDPKTAAGKWYLGTMFVGSLSGFGFLLKFGFTPGTVLTLLTLGLLTAGVVTARGTWRNAGYVQTLALSASYFLLWIFLTTETLKGVGYAANADDPKLLPVRLVLLGLFVIGSVLQVRAIRTEKRLGRTMLVPVPALAN